MFAKQILARYQRITQHKRFALQAYPNPSLTLRTSFMLKMLYSIAGGRTTNTMGRAPPTDYFFYATKLHVFYTPSHICDHVTKSLYT